MKVLVNGGLNLSELDGWWAEAYSPEVGWAIGDGQEHGDDPAWDAQEADALYTLLEAEVIPEFYERDDSGMPVQVARAHSREHGETPRQSFQRPVPYANTLRATICLRRRAIAIVQQTMTLSA